jgi:hypothetical protein
MSYYKEMVEVAKQVGLTAQEIESLKRRRREWVEPKSETFHIGHHAYITREDGTTPAIFVGIKREAIKVFDDLILAKQSQLEGLRFKLVNLAKQGGAA